MFPLCLFWTYIFLANQLQCNCSRENLLSCGNNGCIRTMVLCIFYYLPNKLNSSHKPTFFLWIVTLLLLSLLLLRVRVLKKISLKKKTIFVALEISLLQARKEKLILPLENTSKIWRTWSLALSAHNFLSHLQFFKLSKIIVSECGLLMLPGAFPDKVNPNIDFKDKAVVHCDVPVLKILL